MLSNCKRRDIGLWLCNIHHGKERCGKSESLVPQTEIDAVRALLSGKPRPVGWEERRRRIEEVGAVWPVADDVKLEPVDFDGVKGEWSIVSGADASRLLIY